MIAHIVRDNVSLSLLHGFVSVFVCNGYLNLTLKYRNRYQTEINAHLIENSCCSLNFGVHSRILQRRRVVHLKYIFQSDFSSIGKLL